MRDGIEVEMDISKIPPQMLMVAFLRPDIL